MNKAKRWAGVLLIVASSFVTTGCFDRQELEQQAFVTAMGVDKAPNQMLDCTFQIAVPTSFTGGGQPAKEPLASKSPITVRAHSVAEALTLANTSVERTLTLSHMNTVVFGEDLAKQGLTPVIQSFVRYREFRRTMFTAVAKGSAKEVISANEPMLEASQTRMADSLYALSSRVGLFTTTQLNDLIRSLETPHEDVVMTLLAINQPVEESGGQNQSSPQGNENFNAGEVVRSGGNPMEWIGGALFQRDKMVDTLDGQEMLYLRMLRSTIRSTQINLPLNGNSQPLGLYVHKEGSPEVQVKLKPVLQANIHLAFDADVISEPSILSQKDPMLRQEELETVVEKKLETDITTLMKKLYRQDKVDPIPLSGSIRRQFRTLPQFAAYNWEQQLPTLQPQVDVKVSIRRFGKQLQSVHAE